MICVTVLWCVAGGGWKSNSAGSAGPAGEGGEEARAARARGGGGGARRRGKPDALVNGAA